MNRSSEDDQADERLLELMQGIGLGRQAAETALSIDAVLQNWRRRAQKRELSLRAVKELNIPLDLAQLDVLAAIEGRHKEFGAAQGEETMVQTVAERLNIDPSRASRLVSEVVSAGYARRAVSQADARRTIIELSDSGRRIMKAVRKYKWLLLGNFLRNWREDELATFLELLERYSEWQNDLDQHASRFEKEIASLAEELVQGSETDAVERS